jgi:acetyl-CoA carboxylase biotin carboxyl carrier protein
VDLKDIKAIIDLMRKNSIAEFELEREGFKIRLKRGGTGNTGLAGVGAPGYDEAAPAALLTSPLSLSLPPAPTAKAAVSVEADIKSPMIGTFYRAPSPDAAPYVEVGTEVDAETVVCIIEAMKVMNEIKAEAKGVVTQVLVENAKPVEFGQPLFKIRPT